MPFLGQESSGASGSSLFPLFYFDFVSSNLLSCCFVALILEIGPVTVKLNAWVAASWATFGRFLANQAPANPVLSQDIF